MNIQPFFHKDTATYSYVVSDPATSKCAVIDPVCDFDIFSCKIWFESADLIIEYINKNKLELEWILETHVHADHITAAAHIKDQLGGKIAIGVKIKDVLNYWIPIFNTGADTPADGSQYDKLFTDGEQFKIGNLHVNVLYTPGHTPDCNSYQIEDAIFVGDTLLMPYAGTARTDFPGGSAKDLYRSIQQIYALPDTTRIFVCHDYPPADNEPSCQTTVADEKAHNIMISVNVTEDEFVKARNKKDEGKAVPRYLLPSIQTNIRAGYPGNVENNNITYLKFPINMV